ncbi:MAG: hypothetical protein R3D02_06240 [Hyphomicrobiales bacterium]
MACSKRAELVIGEHLIALSEPDNPHDANAIAHERWTDSATSRATTHQSPGFADGAMSVNAGTLTCARRDIPTIWCLPVMSGDPLLRLTLLRYSAVPSQA